MRRGCFFILFLMYGITTTAQNEDGNFTLSSYSLNNSGSVVQEESPFIRKNSFLYGVNLAVLRSFGSRGERITGLELSGSVGYDWDHRYYIFFSGGVSPMNILQSEFFLPISLGVHRYLSYGKFMPFVGVEGGYSMALAPVYHNEARKGGGLFGSPVLGLRIRSEKHPDQLLQFGLWYQNYRSRGDVSPEHPVRIEIDYRRWVIRYGILF